jgi:hypothetical protein
MPKISIIGTAKKFDFKKAYKQAEDYIINFISKDWKDIHLVSGGAAYGDHIAVRLFLAHPESKLILHLPCKFDKKFEDTGVKDWRINPGNTANYYHSLFSKNEGIDSFGEIENAINSGAKILVYSGFHKRNAEVAKSDYTLAFSYSKGDYPTDGGTSFTWKLCKGIKIHFSC